MAHLRTQTVHLLAGLSLLLVIVAGCSPAEPVPDPVTLTVTVEGSGVGTVTSVPSGIDVANGDEPATLTVEAGTEVTLTAEAPDGSAFVGWTGDCTGTDTCVLTMDADAEVTATFTSVPQTLSVSKAGTGDGSVTSVPSGIALAGGDDSTSAEFDYDIEVELEADPAAGSQFGRWTGDCTGRETCVVTMDGAKNVTAEFVLDSDVTTTPFEILDALDDAEEYKGVTPYGPIGSVDPGSGRLDLGSTTADLDVETVVGLRFNNVSVPESAVITSATLTFYREAQTGTEPVTFTITGHDADNAGTFVAANTAGDPNLFGISSREATSASVLWPNESAWDTTASTPNLDAIVQEIVNRDGWSGGNALAFIIDSDDPNVSPANSRGAQAFGNGTPPELSISYYVPPAP